jgi:CopG antitoxin of type II toxin-antitoxin system
MTNKSKIPEFASYKEEAEFWDKHDFTDFDDETTPVEVSVSPNLSEVVPVRLAPDVLTQLETEAKRMGIGTSTLIRIWVLERLQELPESHNHT